MQVVKGDGKAVEIDCEWFADESIPLELVVGKCTDERGNPKCPVFRECYVIYTRRREV